MKTRWVVALLVLLAILAVALRMRPGQEELLTGKMAARDTQTEKRQTSRTWHFSPDNPISVTVPDQPPASVPVKAAPVETQGNKRDAIRGEYVLRFYDARDQEAFLRAAKEAGIAVLGQMPFGNAVRVRVGDRAELDALLGRTPAPTDVSENYYIRAPPDAEQNPQQPEGTYVGFGNASLDWLGIASGQNSRWGLGTTVAVLDTGVLPHPALAEAHVTRLDLLGGEDRAAPSPHATAVASLIAGSDADLQGVAPASAILSIRVMNDEGVGNTFTLAEGVVAAVEHGAKVINLCVGTYGDSPLLREAVAYARSHGAVVVAASGNDGIAEVLYPAAYDGVVAVSAVDASGRHLYFANRGVQVALSAPGIGITAASTNGTAQAFSGTSAAVPFVSGALSALLSEDARRSGTDAVDILVRNTDDQGAPGRDPEYGSGILNMRRVLQRNQRRLYDVAAADATVVEDASGDLIVTFTGQNRGTEDLNSVAMDIQGGGRRQSTIFSSVGVGRTVSHTLRITRSEVQQAGHMDLIWTMDIRGATDVRPQDNARRLVLSPGMRR